MQHTTLQNNSYHSIPCQQQAYNTTIIIMARNNNYMCTNTRVLTTLGQPNTKIIIHHDYIISSSSSSSSSSWQSKRSVFHPRPTLRKVKLSRFDPPTGTVYCRIKQKLDPHLPSKPAHSHSRYTLKTRSARETRETQHFIRTKHGQWTACLFVSLLNV